MPIKIPNQLPAAEILRKESIFLMEEERATHQDIRELKIAILNLMPIKEETETQLLRLLSNTPLQLELTLIHPASHHSKNTSEDHLISFYTTFEHIRDKKFDGLIITGAPVEQMEFEEVTYWEELKSIMEWSKTHVTSTLHICWGAQAALYYHYGIQKVDLPKKLFGIFGHRKHSNAHQLIRGFDEFFYAPHSRHTGNNKADIEAIEDLMVLADSEEAGVYIACSKDKKQVFVSGHSEYDRYTLRNEYERDVRKGLPIDKPINYFPGNDPAMEPILMWRGHSNLLFSNWLNYFVYQETPYHL